MNAVLITGGAGFIGCHCVREFLARDERPVVVLDKLTYAGNLENLADVADHPRLTFVQGDIGDRPLVARLLAEHQVTWVVNLAAESHVDRSVDEPAPFIQTNVVGTWQLLEACLDYYRSSPADCRAAFRLVHVSTDEVFGMLDGEGAFDESSGYAPNSPYAASKAAADHFARAYFHTYRLPTVVTGSTNNYGAYQLPEKLIPRMIQQALAGEPLTVYGDGQHVREWLHVSDHCDGIYRAALRGRPGQTYLFGSGDERRNLDVVQAICAQLARLAPNSPAATAQRRIRLVSDRPGHDRRYAVNTEKARCELGWAPRRTWDDELVHVVQWYLDHQAWIQRVREDAGGGSRLGLARKPAEQGP